MALSIEKLGIYRESCKLFVFLAEITNHCPRPLRQPIFNEMIKNCNAMISLIIEASHTTKDMGKCYVIDEALRYLALISLTAKLGNDAKAISHSHYAKLITFISSIKAQGIGWSAKNLIRK